MDQPVGQFLDQLAARIAAPSGGGGAALTAAIAAGLVAMAARFSDAQLPAAVGLADRADLLRRRAAALADEDASAYQAVLDAYALPAAIGERRQRIREALQGAAAIPLEIAEIAAQVADMARLAEAEGNPNLRGDATVAALLADAAARCAACLVDINVDQGALDPDLSRRAALSAAAAHAVARQIATSIHNTPNQDSIG
jgi:formiminotetrahydrofolate cyclodeaminase